MSSYYFGEKPRLGERFPLRGNCVSEKLLNELKNQLGDDFDNETLLNNFDQHHQQRTPDRRHHYNEGINRPVGGDSFADPLQSPIRRKSPFARVRCSELLRNDILYFLNFFSALESFDTVPTLGGFAFI